MKVNRRLVPYQCIDPIIPKGAMFIMKQYWDGKVMPVTFTSDDLTQCYLSAEDWFQAEIAREAAKIRRNEERAARRSAEWLERRKTEGAE